MKKIFKRLLPKNTIVTNVSAEMLLMNEEVFGPVLPVMPVQNWQEAVNLTNNTKYGLTGSVWTKNKTLGRRIAEKLDVGVASVNTH